MGNLPSRDPLGRAALLTQEGVARLNVGLFVQSPPDACGPLAGSQLNHYIFQSRIGSAGGITVYPALDTKHNRDVAIKVLPQLLPGRQRDVAPGKPA